MYNIIDIRGVLLDSIVVATNIRTEVTTCT